jgi:hypothetical protein
MLTSQLLKIKSQKEELKEELLRHYQDSELKR